MNSNSFQQRLLGLQDNLLNFAYMLTSNPGRSKRSASRHNIKSPR